MIATVKVFWGICIFRGGPEHAPSQPAFIVVLLLIDLLLSASVFVGFAGVPLASALTLIAFQLCITGILLWIVLRVMNLHLRFPRCFAAFLGADIIIGLMLSCAWILTSGSFLVGLPFVVWNISINAHILHRAMDVPMTLGAVTAIGIFMTTNLLSGATQ